MREEARGRGRREQRTKRELARPCYLPRANGSPPCSFFSLSFSPQASPPLLLLRALSLSLFLSFFLRAARVALFRVPSYIAPREMCVCVCAFAKNVNRHGAARNFARVCQGNRKKLDGFLGKTRHRAVKINITLL